MAFFVEYEPDNKKDCDEFYGRYDLIIRRSVFSDYIEVAKITTDRRGEDADLEKNLEFFKKKFELRDEKENEYFIAALKDKKNPETPEDVIGYSHIEYCDFGSEKYKKYEDINTPSGWYLLGLGVYPKYRRLRIGSKLTSSARRPQGYRAGFLLITLVCLFLGLAQDAIGGSNPSVTIDLGQTGPKQTAVVLQIIALLTVLSLAPAFFIMVTSFTRVVIVLSFLRQALGTQSVPPNQVLISLALFITVFVMAPVGEAVYSQAIQPLLAEQISHEEAWTKGIQPIRTFMLKQVRDKDLELFIELSKRPKPETVDQVPIHVVIPAYILSELRVAFQIGFLIYIPFLIVDMVVASVLMSMGMMMLPPTMISLPFKLILFVLADGWNLVVGSLVKSFQ